MNKTFEYENSDLALSVYYLSYLTLLYFAKNKISWKFNDELCIFFTFLLWILFIIVLRQVFFQNLYFCYFCSISVMEKCTPMHMLLCWINIVSYSINMRQFLKNVSIEFSKVRKFCSIFTKNSSFWFLAKKIFEGPIRDWIPQQQKTIDQHSFLPPKTIL